MLIKRSQQLKNSKNKIQNKSTLEWKNSGCTNKIREKLRQVNVYHVCLETNKKLHLFSVFERWLKMWLSFVFNTCSSFFVQFNVQVIYKINWWIIYFTLSSGTKCILYNNLMGIKLWAIIKKAYKESLIQLLNL